MFGHVDSKDGAPGALDNATGTAALLGLAELLGDHGGRHTVELVAVNGEDYYAATGEKLFVATNEGRWEEIVVGLNADGAGWLNHGTEVSRYGTDEHIDRVVSSAMRRRRGMVEGGPWYQSDHSLLIGVGRPAVAVTSEGFAELCATVTHTAADRLELADPAKVAEIARFYADVIAEVQRRRSARFHRPHAGSGTLFTCPSRNIVANGTSRRHLSQRPRPRRVAPPVRGAVASSSSGTARHGCITTSGSRSTACSCPGPCPRVQRSIRRSVGWRCTSRTTRSSTSISRA